MSDNIEWGLKQTPQSEAMKLKEIKMGVAYAVTITDLRNTSNGFVVASVESKDLAGDTLWLKGKFGLQNGAAKLIQLCDGSTDPVDYIGKTFLVSKVENQDSMTGYNYDWDHA